MKATSAWFSVSVRSLAALALLSGLASAATITVTGVDSQRGQYNVWIGERGADVQAYYAGVILLRLNADDGSHYDRDSLCVDLFTDINIGPTYNTTVLQPSDVPGKHLERVSWLVDNALLPTQNPTFPTELLPGQLVRTSAQGAGIQLAIWDIVHDGGDGFALGAGSVQGGSASHPTDAAVLGWAQTYVTLSAGKSSNLAYIYKSYELGGNQNEVQMLAGPLFRDGGPRPNPEPSTLALAGGALIAGARFALRKRRAQTPR